MGAGREDVLAGAFGGDDVDTHAKLRQKFGAEFPGEWELGSIRSRQIRENIVEHGAIFGRFQRGVNEGVLGPIDQLRQRDLLIEVSQQLIADSLPCD